MKKILAIALISITVISGCLTINRDELLKSTDYINGVYVDRDCSNSNFTYRYYLGCKDDTDATYKIKFCMKQPMVEWGKFSKLCIIQDISEVKP